MDGSAEIEQGARASAWSVVLKSCGSPLPPAPVLGRSSPVLRSIRERVEGGENNDYGSARIDVGGSVRGAAVYINIAEQPARLALDDQSLLMEWKPAYKRGAAMQAPLAIAGFLLGFAAWWQSGDLTWMLGALLMIANWPVTFFAIMPTNNRLMAMDPQMGGPQTRAMIQTWGSLHAIRTSLGFAATLVFLWAIVS